MISVALCTYNGERYIREQIESILNQTLPVDEIVVCDDGSTDETLQIIEQVGKNVSTNIRIHQNEKNLGTCANFQKAVDLCRGSIIFLSDQDDVWCSNKVKTIVDYFEQNNEKQVVFSDGLLINSQNRLIENKTLWSSIGFTPLAQHLLENGYGPELFSYENRATGATMAFRRSFVNEKNFINLCNGTILHDGALAMLGIASNTLGFIAQPLINYRIHPKQAVGIGEATWKPLSDDARGTSPLCEQWHSVSLPSPFNERIAFIRARHHMKNQPLGPFRMICFVGSYCKFYHTKWFSFLLFDLRKWGTHIWVHLFK